MAAGDVVTIGGRRYISRGTTGKESISKSEAKKRLKDSKSKYVNITQEVKTDGSVVETTKTSSGKVISKKTYSSPGTKTTPSKNDITQEAKTKMLRARVIDTRTGRVVDKGNFKLDKNFDRRYQDYLKANRINRSISIKNAKSYLINTGTNRIVLQQYTDDQLLKIAAANQLSNKIELQTKLNRIDKSNLSTIEKEKQKRELLGITTGKKGEQISLTAKVKRDRDKKIKEIRNSLNTITPGDTKRPFSNKYLNDLENRLVTIYNRVVNKPVSQRTNKDMLLVAGSGLSAVVLSTLNKVPGIVWRNIEAAVSPIDTAKGIINIIVNKNERLRLQNTLSDVANRAKKGDVDAISSIAAEILVNKVSIKKVNQQLSKLSPKFVKSTGETFVIKKSIFSTPKKFLKQKLPKVFDKFIDNPEIILKKQTVKSGATPLSEAVKLQNKVITAVNSSADRLTSWIRRKKIIRKPFNLTGLEKKFPKGELSFPLGIRKILNKFDNGLKLTDKEFVNINRWLKNNIAPNATLLERSLFADPASGLRVSRLGASKTRTATLKDIIKGNFTLRSNKPQVLIFENVKVAKFPKYLKDVEKKLKSGRKLTEKETNRLIAWQIKTGSGKFKPIGSTIYKGGIELEVTLAPGELIKRVKRVGFTYINGKKVDFVTAKVYKPTKALRERIKKANQGKLTDKQLSKLEKDLSKKLGRRIKIETPKSRIRRVKSDLPVLRVSGRNIRIIKGISRLSRNKSKIKTTRKVKSTRKTKPSRSIKTKPVRKQKIKSTRKTKPSRSRKTKPVRKSKSKRTSKPSKRVKQIKPTTPKTLRPNKVTKGGRVIKPIKVTKLPLRPIVFDKLKPNQVATFEGVYRERRNPRLNYNKKTNPVVIKRIRITTTRNRLLNELSKKVDNSLVRSMQITIKGVTTKTKKDINKPARLKKFTIKKKNSKVLKLVEKSKYTIDKPGEKRGLKKAKKTSTKKRTPSKRISKVSKVKKSKKSSKKASKSVKRYKPKKKGTIKRIKKK